jgi:acyl-CoA dehydrogenase
VLKEIDAVAQGDPAALGHALLGHGRHLVQNCWRSLVHAPLVGEVPAGFEREARKIARLAAKFAFTSDMCMGVLGGRLKRLELLSSRLGDVLSHLYMASACVWRYAWLADVRIEAVARGAVRRQIWLASQALRELFDNLPNPLLRVAGTIALRGLSPIRRLHDTEKLAIADTLRDPQVVRLLCPDVEMPKSGGLCDLQEALRLASELGEEEVLRLGSAIRQHKPFEEIAATSASPHALDFLRALDKVIQVDSFGPDGADN